MIWRVYEISLGKYAGEYVECLGEQIGGDFTNEAAAKTAGEAAGCKFTIKHVGGIEQPKPIR